MAVPAADLTGVRFHGAPTTRRRWSERRSPRTAVRTAAPDAPVAPPARDVVSGLPALVLARCGLDAGAYRPRPLERRVPACLRVLKVDDEAAAMARLEATPELLGTALGTLLIGVSEFFRDDAVFDALRTHVVGALGERSGPLRVWSVGCSSGPELYSVAMLLADAGLLDRAELLGTDCRPDAVDSARAGVFPDAALAGVAAVTRRRYFEAVSGGWRVRDALRRRTAWRVADASREIADGPWDLVLCRNLLMYLEPRAAHAILARITRTLPLGGFLVVGKAERPPAGLALTAVTRCVYRR